MCGKDGVVRLYNCGGHLWCWVDREFQFGFLSVINGETLHKEGGESGSGTTTEGVEDKETLKTGTLIGKLSDSVKDKIDDFLTDGVVTTSVVVGGIFFAGDQLLGVEQLAVGTGSDLIDNSWLKIDKDGSWDVFSSSSFAEEGVEGIISTSDGLVTWHLTIRLDTMLQAVELPASITDLDTGLTDMDGDALTHFYVLFFFN